MLQVNCLQSTLQSVQQATTPSTLPSILQHKADPRQKQPTVSCLLFFQSILTIFCVFKSKRTLDLPPEPSHNPYQDMEQLPVCTHLTRTGGFQPSRSVQAHSHGATALDIHPHKPVVATASDDHTWKLWTISR